MVYCVYLFCSSYHDEFETLKKKNDYFKIKDCEIQKIKNHRYFDDIYINKI